MTELLYRTDSYLREFEARIVAADPAEAAVVLDRTAFYPGGGGQPCDLGTLQAGAERLQVQRVGYREGQVWHWLDRLPAGLSGPVRGALDWERRYRLMRTHTSLHILCGVIWRDHKAAVTGGNMEPLRGRLDFEFETMSGELLREIEQKLQAEVQAGREVRVQVLPREEAERIPDLIRTKVSLLPKDLTEIRTVEIVGLDLQADGGTHVGNTREVGPIRIAQYKSKGRINKRIEVELGE
jgi:misacylated tRNA(Ala) deacylase